jgi:hypothetical protein|tara:strand:+ start:723 stop:1511 length:789 start_codon:yes stop_codon:yes gene_type:complete
MFSSFILEGLRSLGAISDSQASNPYTFESSYPCLNQDPVDNSDCPEDDPYCNCPCQELRPDDSSVLDLWPWLFAGVGGGWLWGEGEDKSEPTTQQIQEAFEETKECVLIEEVLGEEYLGCMWKDSNHPSSCNCPCVGEKFKEYIEYNRTDATYWDTPKTTPLWRNAQMQLINSQKMSMVLNGDLTLRPGKPITIANVTPGDENSDTKKKFTGRWLVSDIEHIITSNSHRMNLVLTRDSTVIDPNTSESLTSSLLKFIGSIFS